MLSSSDNRKHGIPATCRRDPTGRGAPFKVGKMGVRIPRSARASTRRCVTTLRSLLAADIPAALYVLWPVAQLVGKRTVNASRCWFESSQVSLCSAQSTPQGWVCSTGECQRGFSSRSSLPPRTVELECAGRPEGRPGVVPRSTLRVKPISNGLPYLHIPAKRG